MLRRFATFALTGLLFAAAAHAYVEAPHSLGQICKESTHIVLMEVADSKTHWMQPGDYDVVTLLSYTGRLGDHIHGVLPDRIHVAFAEGDVWALSPDAPMTALQPFLTIAGAESHDRNQLLAPHRIR